VLLLIVEFVASSLVAERRPVELAVFPLTVDSTSVARMAPTPPPVDAWLSVTVERTRSSSVSASAPRDHRLVTTDGGVGDRDVAVGLVRSSQVCWMVEPLR
jgi:hypothetical protein